MALKKQFYGIKLPFRIDNNDNFFLNLNETMEDKVASEIVHVILTTKRTRIRMPEFGTRLIEYIFEPKDSLTWESIKSEIREAVGTYVPNAALDDIAIVSYDDRENEEENGLYLDIRYSVYKGESANSYRMGVKL